MLRVKKGYAIYYFCFDIGDEVRLDQAERLWKGEAVPEADPDDARELTVHLEAHLRFRGRVFDLTAPRPSSGPKTRARAPRTACGP